MILSAQIEVRKATGLGYTWNVRVDGRLLPINGGAVDVKSAFQRATTELADYQLTDRTGRPS
jgi:hypothetical protein